MELKTRVLIPDRRLISAKKKISIIFPFLLKDGIIAIVIAIVGIIVLGLNQWFNPVTMIVYLAILGAYSMVYTIDQDNKRIIDKLKLKKKYNRTAKEYRYRKW